MKWVNAQPQSQPLTCLGDGHDGIWNIYQGIGTESQRREILDWFHLVENLGKVCGSQRRLDAVEAFYGKGMLIVPLSSSKIGSMSESGSFLLIWASIDTELLTIAIIKQKVFQSVPVRLNQRSNK